MIQKIKCFFGFHKRRVLGFSLPFYQQGLSKCDCCGKYELYHYGINCGYWTDDISSFPKEVQEHIKNNNL